MVINLYNSLRPLYCVCKQRTQKIIIIHVSAALATVAMPNSSNANTLILFIMLRTLSGCSIAELLGLWLSVASLSDFTSGKIMIICITITNLGDPG